MSSKIDAYLDCVSPYSYFAFLHLQRNTPILKEHGVEVEIHPIFLGGINQGSGNKPPWTLPAKAKLSPFDLERAKKYFDVPNLKRPDVFPIVSLLPQRALVYLKTHYPHELYEQALHCFYIALWQQNIDISQPAKLEHVLVDAVGLSSADAVAAVAGASTPDSKAGLQNNTNEALEQGAYGAPWFRLRNAKGVEEPFFGSDRFAYMWEFLGLPWQDVQLLGKGKAEAKL